MLAAEENNGPVCGHSFTPTAPEGASHSQRELTWKGGVAPAGRAGAWHVRVTCSVSPRGVRGIPETVKFKDLFFSSFLFSFAPDLEIDQGPASLRTFQPV